MTGPGRTPLSASSTSYSWKNGVLAMTVGNENVSRSSAVVLLAVVCLRGVVLHCGQDHLQRELFVPPVHVQPTVTASLRCTPTFTFSHDADC